MTPPLAPSRDDVSFPEPNPRTAKPDNPVTVAEDITPLLSTAVGLITPTHEDIDAISRSPPPLCEHRRSLCSHVCLWPPLTHVFGSSVLNMEVDPETGLLRFVGTKNGSSTGWSKFEVQYPDEPKYSITGADSQVVTVQLAGNEMVYSEPGTMMFMSDYVKGDTECGGCLQRCCSGESCCTMRLENTQQELGFVGLTPNFPSKVIPVDLSSPMVNGTLQCKAGAYMAHFGEVEIQTDFDCNPCRACCGGAGFVRQELVGTGTVFLNSSGTIMQKELVEGEKIVVDTNCVLAWAQGVEMELQSAGGCCGMALGGEGVFNTVFTGPGLVMVTSMNQNQYQVAVAPEPSA